MSSQDLHCRRLQVHREYPVGQHDAPDWPKKRTTLGSHAFDCLLPPHGDYPQGPESWMLSVSASSKEADLRRSVVSGFGL